MIGEKMKDGKFIFHSFTKQYDLNIADPSSMQDACQI